MFLKILFLVSCLIILYVEPYFIAFSSSLIVQYVHEHNVIVFYESLICMYVYVCYRGPLGKLAKLPKQPSGNIV